LEAVPNSQARGHKGLAWGDGTEEGQEETDSGVVVKVKSTEITHIITSDDTG
jgi:hypothetical protein